MTVSERLKVVEDFAAAIKQKYPQTDQYNVLIFGSFLTERYTDESDIDIGVFSMMPGLTFAMEAIVPNELTYDWLESSFEVYGKAKSWKSLTGFLIRKKMIYLPSENSKYRKQCKIYVEKIKI